MDNVVMAMTMFGVQVSPADRASGPGLGLALLAFLQARFPAVVAPAAVLTAASSITPPPASAAPVIAASAVGPTAVAAVPTVAASGVAAPDVATPATALVVQSDNVNDFPDFEIDPDTCNSEGAFVPSAPSGSNLSAAEKGKLPVYPGN
ncbi:hypothetical protein BN14_08927 [Rhizoctonia solani AG-1 IB]|uniref:Uncharacterized protein n=1 Tax=Thanatephorus cucumeris (strain AG1-IB / isolate 7/3/14) TaxID=1108050 RepID=M5C680_THACB|nr:hypothetical protein BN14_08927 [Rhizoctonia solani AG-1 IB]